MNIITINVGQSRCMDPPLLIGYAGEDSVDAVDFDFAAWAQDYGEGTISLELMRASDTAPYPAILTVDGTVARWTVSDVDTARRGPGVAQLVYKPTGATKKSAIYKFYVGRSLTEPGGDDPWEPIIERMEEILAEMQAQAAAADQSAEDASGSARDAEAWAVGERGGEPVPVTDETHENNAKYYAEQAGETTREFTEETVPAAVRAVNEAGQAQAQAVNTAGAAAVQAVSAERAGALDAIGTARAGALDAIGTAGQTAVSDVDTAKTGAVQDVNTAKTDALTAIEQKSTTEQAAVEQKGEDALAALQEYADLPGEVTDLKSAVKKKAPAIYDTASGAIASFEDGADDMPLKALTVNIEPVQSGTGDPSPENVRPISGWTGCNLARTGKNLWKTFDSQTINGVTLTVDDDGGCSLTGTATANAIFVIPVTILPGSYYLSANNAEVIGLSVRLMLVSNTGGEDKQIYLSVANAEAPITLDTEYNQLRIRVNAGPAFTSTKFYPQLELGSTATVYEPFVANDIYPVTFPSEAGTVYGGTLDVVSAVLTVDRSKATINGSEPITWTVVSETARNFAFVNASSFLPGVNRATNYIQQKDLYNIMTAIHASSRSPNTAFINGGYLNLAFDIGTVSTDAELKAWLANNPIEVVYELATPIEIALTPMQIETLLGTNNIWADCGSVSVDYPADTKLYIQKVNKPTDDDMTADTQIASGKYFIIGNTLYLSTTVIPAGDAIIPGTNCTKTNLAAALNALNT